MRQSVIDGARAPQPRRAGWPRAAPLDAIEQGYVPGLSWVGEQFGEGELYLPDMMLAARAMQKAVDTLEPEMARLSTQRKVLGRVVIGTVKGDIHDIGKNLVGMMLSTSGFEVHDLGVDVSPERFVEAAREHDADVIGVSALLTTTMAGQRTVVEKVAAAGMRPKVKVIVGGAPASASWASEIGADGYSEDAIGAVALIRRLVGAETATA
jgi:corrinoid protein of di/trimethylamine methyltransferase